MHDGCRRGFVIVCDGLLTFMTDNISFFYILAFFLSVRFFAVFL